MAGSTITFDPTLPNDNNSPALLAIVSVLTAVTLIVMSLRVWVRAVMLRSWGADDWCLVLAMISAIGTLICWIGASTTGLGRYDQYITLDESQNLAHWWYPHFLMIVFGVSCVKLSVGFVLLRFVERPLFKKLIWGSIVFLILFTITCEATLIFSCVPPAANWDFALQATAKCFSVETFTAIGLFNTVVNIFTDVFFATLPVPVIWTLQLNRKTKISLLLVLSLGYFSCGAAIVKSVYQAHTFTTPNQGRWSLYYLWSYIELCIGIMAAALPALRPLVKTFLGTTKSNSASGGIMGASGRKRNSSYGYGRGENSFRRVSGLYSDTMHLDSMADRDDIGHKAYAGPFVRIAEETGSDKSLSEHEAPSQMHRANQERGILKTTNVTISKHKV